MNKKFLIISIVVIVVIASFFIFRKSTSIKNYPADGSTIIAFGDSLMQGVGATKDNDFPSVLSAMLGEPIINMGVSGNTTAQGLDRIDEAISLDPKVVMVLLGGNDFLRKIPIEETFQNLDTIVSKFQENGAVVVLLGIRGGLLPDPYKERFEKIAKDRGTVYVPNVLAGLLGKAKYMSDPIHPNDAGYRKIAEKVYPVLKQVIK